MQFPSHTTNYLIIITQWF